MNYKNVAVALLSALAMFGCKSTSMTQTKETKKSYVIYDIQVTDGVTPTQMSSAIKRALQSNTSSVTIVEDLPPYPLPEQAPRFQLTNPFGKNSAMSALAGGIKIPTCEGALIYAQAVDSSMSSYGENTQFYTCLWQYKDGYHVDVYTQFQIESGGLDNLGQDLVRGIMGDSSQFIPRTINSIKTNLEELNVQTKLVTAYPDQLASQLQNTQ
ncbi:hypothetical protein ABT56_20985 [Photobacterium aquae]|uniref:Lipoprotein n=1 Tax=Photobacterium aquae TaxID=1195763 RepID=A0A0J1GTT9_9GAMM|nr:hypothetical protein [Photobacterium aquae]KLV02849.1 hypothetical protein ABT56_20985 [Photobacterium aquae]